MWWKHKTVPKTGDWMSLWPYMKPLNRTKAYDRTHPDFLPLHRASPILHQLAAKITTVQTCQIINPA